MAPSNTMKNSTQGGGSPDRLPQAQCVVSSAIRACLLFLEGTKGNLCWSPNQQQQQKFYSETLVLNRFMHFILDNF